MRIVIDLQGAQTGSRFRGIGRYTVSLVTQLLLISQEKHQIIIVLNGMLPESIDEIRDYFFGLIRQCDIRVWSAIDPVAMHDKDSHKRAAFAEAVRENYIKTLDADIIILSSVMEGFSDNFVCSVNRHDQTPCISILYDLIPLLNCESYIPNKEVAYWYFDKLSQLCKSSVLLAISESSRQEAIKYLDFDPERVTNISAATDGSFRKKEYSPAGWSELSRKLSITKPFVMYTSASDDRKNHRGLMSAFARLDSSLRKKFQLVFAGGLPEQHRREFMSHANSVGLQYNDVIITGHLTDHELEMLYNACYGFVFPSWHEGFGLPILEAMQCEKAVIASNCSSIPEVVGNDEALFDPFDVSSIASKLERLLTDETFRFSLEEHSRRQVSAFSWEKSAMRALATIEELSDSGAVGSRGRFTEIECRARSKAVIDCVTADLQRIAAGCGVTVSEYDRVIAENFNIKGNRPQILVDVSELRRMNANTGIQRVVRSVVREWLKKSSSDWDIRPVFARYKFEGYYYAGRTLDEIIENPDFVEGTEAVSVEAGDIFIGLDFTPFDLPRQMSTLETWRRKGVWLACLVYDLLPIQYPHFFNNDIPSLTVEWLKQIAGFDAAVCISKSVADELDSWLRCNSAVRRRKIQVSSFKLGSEITTGKDCADFDIGFADILREIGDSDSFLMVGTLEPRKSHEQVLDAFEILWSQDFRGNLIFVGKAGWNTEKLLERVRSHPLRDKQFFLFEDISDSMLDALYSASTCLIMASKGEGFGLPIAEAAYRRLPLILRDISVFREISEGRAVFFDDVEEPEAICRAVTYWVDLKQNCEVPDSGLIKQLTWAESADQLLGTILSQREVR